MELINIALQAAKKETFSDKGRNKWINWGCDNLYPNYLLSLSADSAPHRGIINGKISYVNGSNTIITGDETKFNSLFGSLSYMDFRKRIAADYEQFNFYAIQVIKNTSGGVGILNHLPACNVRLSKEGRTVFYSDNWNDRKPVTTELSIYSEKESCGVIVFREYSAGMVDYPQPTYQGAISYIEIDKKIGEWHLNNITNGFSAGTLINFANGEPTKEEQKIIEGKINRKFTGSENAGRAMISFSDGKDRAPEVTSLMPNNFDKLYDQLVLSCQQQIFTAHEVTSPMLFGVKTEGQLGGRDELATAHELFITNYANSRMQSLDEMINYMIRGEGIKIKTEPKKLIGEEQQKPTAEAFCEHHDDIVLTQLLSKGRPQDQFRIIEEVGQIETEKEAVLMERIFRIRQGFGVEDEKAILSFLKGNPTATTSAISEATGLDKEIVNDTIDDLLDSGQIKGVPGERITLTPKGNKQIDRVSALKVMYKYALRAGVPDAKKSRDYCTKLMRSNKLFTREEITSSVNEQGTNAWTYRGGWYHNPSSGINTPYCRHVWKQLIVEDNG